MKKILKLFIGLLFLGTLVFANQETKTVKVGLGYNGRSYDPHRHTDSSTLAITKQIYNNLFVLNEENNLDSELAKEYKIDEKNNELIIKLREDIYFQDGEKLNSKIVADSLERNKTIPVTKVLVAPIDTIEIIDDLTLKIKYASSPDILLHNLTHSSMAIVKLNKENLLVGTGAFSLKDWGTGQKVILEKNKNYFKGEPKVDIIEFITIPEAPNRYIALETGEIQIAYDISAIDVKAFKNKNDLNIINEISYGTDFLSINTEKFPLNDKKLRQAIAYALDRDAINEIVFEGTAKVADSILTPNTFGYFSEKKDGIQNNLEKAKEIMKEYKTPIKIELWIYEDTSKYQMAQVIQANLKEIGIDVSIQTLELSSFLQLTAQGNHNALIGLWYTSTGDADYGLYPLLHESSKGAVGNRSFYSNSNVNELLDDARKSTSNKDRLEKYKEVQSIVSMENPIIPIVYKMYSIGLNKDLKGFKFNPNGNHILEEIEYNK